MASQPPLDIESLYERHAETLLVFFTRRTFDPEVATDLWAETFAQALAGRRKSVSYTHLDVYKRQVSIAAADHLAAE